jgi:hypothetical protein
VFPVRYEQDLCAPYGSHNKQRLSVQAADGPKFEIVISRIQKKMIHISVKCVLSRVWETIDGVWLVNRIYRVLLVSPRFTHILQWSQ